MNHDAAVSNAKDIADRVLAPAARQNDKDGRFSSEAIKAFGPVGLLGLMLPANIGGSAPDPARSQRSSARSPRRTLPSPWSISCTAAPPRRSLRRAMAPPLRRR